MQRKFPSIAVIFLLVFGIGSLANSEPVLSPELRRFGDLIVERLDLMKGVAAYKFHSSRPVEDLAREGTVIEAGKAQAHRLGIELQSVEPFLQAQIDAAKRVQRLWILAWQTKAAPKPGKNRDLASDLRPAISNATHLLLRLLLRARTELERVENREALARYLHDDMVGLGLRDIDARKIIEGAGAAQLSPGSEPVLVDTIRGSGVLRVGTTGDYPPFSHWNGEAFIGIDIDLARQLASNMGVEPSFIRTSWPTLMEDLSADSFDIAISGITNTPERSKVAFFSQAYHTGGKTPIALCDEAEAYDDLAKIDREGVWVVVNPGGTNERFARANIKTAMVVLFSDNTAIFDEIIEGRADVMITDAIEVTFQTARNPELCPAMPGKTLTVSKKAFMMPRDETLRAYVDDWLQQTMAAGTLEAVFKKHLNAPTQPPR